MSRIFIVLATWEPIGRLFDQQLASLSAQTFQDWSGVVVDDASGKEARSRIADRIAQEPRLRFESYPRRAGFYQNFERGLALTPNDCDYVAFCDQDDRWVPHKLERQVAAMDARPEAQLCYSDLRLVGEDGALVDESFWSVRPHCSRFREVFYNNVVTGATVLFRRHLLQTALPFPKDPGCAFHDHWLALCAMVTSELVYLEEPLVDYTQHAGNVLGARALQHVGHGAFLRFLGEAAVRPRELAKRLNELREDAISKDERLCAFATALQSRCPTLAAEKAKALRPFLRSSRGARILDLAIPTLLGSLVSGEETDLGPLKISLGMTLDALR